MREYWFILQDTGDVIDKCEFRDFSAAEDHGYDLAAKEKRPVAVFEKLTVCWLEED